MILYMGLKENMMGKWKNWNSMIADEYGVMVVRCCHEKEKWLVVVFEGNRKCFQLGEGGSGI